MVQRRGRSRSRRDRKAGGTVLDLPRYDSSWKEYTLLRRGLDGEGFGLRRTMDLQDMDPKLCIYWGSFSGRQVGDSWIQPALGGYIPMDIKGVRHVVAATRGPRDGKGGAVRLQGASQARYGGRA